MKNKKLLLSLSVGLLVSVGSLQASIVSINTCTSCHGKQFEQKALGKSKIVKNMSEKEIYTALKGYKDGTYGGSMKVIMKEQVSKIDNIQEEVHTVYTYIHSEKESVHKKVIDLSDSNTIKKDNNVSKNKEFSIKKTIENIDKKLGVSVLIGKLHKKFEQINQEKHLDFNKVKKECINNTKEFNQCVTDAKNLNKLETCKTNFKKKCKKTWSKS